MAAIIAGVSGGASKTSESFETDNARTIGHWISLSVTGVMMIVVDWFMFNSLNRRKTFSTCRKYGPLILCLVATPLILAESCRHILGDYNIWNSCGDNSDFPRVNQTWNSGCWSSSSEYKCNIPCCVPKSELNSTAMYPGILGPHRSIAQQKVLDKMSKYYENPNDIKLGIFPPVIFSQYGDTFLNKTSGMYECTCHCTNSENLFHLSAVGWTFTITMTYLGFIGLAVGSLWNADIISKCKKMRREWRRLRGNGGDSSDAQNNYSGMSDIAIVEDGRNDMFSTQVETSCPDGG